MPEENKRPRGQERRGGDPILHALARLQKSFDDRHTENVENIKTVQEQGETLKTQVDRLLKGFPGGDPEGHCRYHDAVIDEKLRRSKLWLEIQTHIMKGGSWAIVGGICWGIFQLCKFYVLYLLGKSQ